MTEDLATLTDLADDLFCECEEIIEEHTCSVCGKLVEIEEDE